MDFGRRWQKWFASVIVNEHCIRTHSKYVCEQLLCANTMSTMKIILKENQVVALPFSFCFVSFNEDRKSKKYDKNK